jgi:hypothetical protein
LRREDQHDHEHDHGDRDRDVLPDAESASDSHGDGIWRHPLRRGRDSVHHGDKYEHGDRVRNGEWNGNVDRHRHAS